MKWRNQLIAMSIGDIGTPEGVRLMRKKSDLKLRRKRRRRRKSRRSLLSWQRRKGTSSMWTSDYFLLQQQMRRITKFTSRMGLQPLPIIRFDNPDHNCHLTSPTQAKSEDANPSTFAKHRQVLAISSAQANSVCLSSNQIGLSSKLIVIAKEIKLKEGRPDVAWINGGYDDPAKFNAYQRPLILSGDGLVEQEEESISFPFIHSKIKRYNRITVAFRDQQRRIEEQMEGPLSWVFQQSFDQLEGELLLDWRAHHGQIWFQEQMIKYFPKTTSVIEEYVLDLNKIFKDYPALITQPQSFDLSKPKMTEFQQKLLPFEADFFRRLVKYYSKEMTALEQKIEKGFQEEYRWQKTESLKTKVIQK